MKLLKTALLLACAAVFLAAVGIFAQTQRIHADTDALALETLDTRELIAAEHERTATLDAALDDVINVEERIVAQRARCCADAKTLEDLILAGKSTRRIGYLTFDDGPYLNHTGGLLDILDDCGVKATFFTMGKWRTKTVLSFLTAEALAGHTVANHTFTHAITGGLYSSADSFAGAVMTMDATITQYAGIKPTLLRFPGGSSCCPSALRPGIRAWLRENGYGYVDWNVTSGDSGPYITDPAYEASFILSQTQNKKIAVVLMHDFSTVTPRALPMIVQGMREQGYVLLPLFYESNMVNK